MNVFLWHVHGSWTTAFVQGRHQYFVPVVPGRGSAIFLHLARPDLAPTEGCVALPEADLRAALAAGLAAVEVLPG